MMSCRRRKTRKAPVIPRLLKEEDDAFVVNGYSSDDEWGVRVKTTAAAVPAKRRRAGAGVVMAGRRMGKGIVHGPSSRRPKRCLRPFFLPRCTIVLRCHEDASEGVWVSWEASASPEDAPAKSDKTPLSAAKSRGGPRRRGNARKAKNLERLAQQVDQNADRKPLKRSSAPQKNATVGKSKTCRSRVACARRIRAAKSVTPAMVATERVKSEPVSPARKELVSSSDFQDLLLTAGSCLKRSPLPELPELSAALPLKDFAHRAHEILDQKYLVQTYMNIKEFDSDKADMEKVIRNESADMTGLYSDNFVCAKAGFEETPLQPIEEEKHEQDEEEAKDSETQRQVDQSKNSNKSSSTKQEPTSCIDFPYARAEPKNAPESGKPSSLAETDDLSHRIHREGNEYQADDQEGRVSDTTYSFGQADEQFRNLEIDEQVDEADASFDNNNLFHSPNACEIFQDQETSISWRKVSQRCKFVVNHVKFCPSFNPGPKLDDDLVNGQPVDYFLELCNQRIVTFLVSNINLHLQSVLESARASKNEEIFVRACDWLPTTPSEIYKFFAVCINMSVVQKPRICDYWMTSPEYSCTPWFLEMFTRRRFFVLYRSILHVSHVASKWKEKVSRFLKVVVDSFQQLYQPGQEVVVEELRTSGGSSCTLHGVRRVEESRDPNDWEMKCFILSDAQSGYVWNMVPYFGDFVDKSHDTGCSGSHPMLLPQEKIVLELSAPLNAGHHVFTSSRFTTVSLVRKLHTRGILCTGNVKQTRDLPTELLDAVLVPGDVKYYQSQHVLCSAWKDMRTAKPIIFCSSSCSAQDCDTRNSSSGLVAEGNNETLPPFLASYKTQNRRLMEHCALSNGLHLRTRKDRWKKVFWWTFELFLFNAYSVYSLKNRQTNLSLLDFKKLVVEQLSHHHVTNSCETTVSSMRFRVRLADARHLICTDSQNGSCAFCRHSSQTNFVCKHCPGRPYLHAQGCFAKYHEVLELRTSSKITAL